MMSYKTLVQTTLALAIDRHSCGHCVQKHPHYLRDEPTKS